MKKKKDKRHKHFLVLDTSGDYYTCCYPVGYPFAYVPWCGFQISAEEAMKKVEKGEYIVMETAYKLLEK